MQSLNKIDEVVQTDVFHNKNLDGIASRIEVARSKGAIKHVLSEIPNKGSIVEINGLKFEVKFTDYKRGELRLQLVVVTKEL